MLKKLYENLSSFGLSQIEIGMIMTFLVIIGFVIGYVLIAEMVGKVKNKLRTGRW